MTDATRKRTLPLQGSPNRSRLWLVLLAFVFPAVVIVASFALAPSHHVSGVPALLAGGLVLGICGLTTLWILRMLRRIAVALDGDALDVDTGIVARRFPLSSLRAAGLRVVSLAEHTELKPVLRAWGIGMPGLASGWFRLRNGGKALCILTGRERITVLRSDEGIWILLSLADPSPLKSALDV
jgi:hypothetical protein